MLTSKASIFAHTIISKVLRTKPFALKCGKIAAYIESSGRAALLERVFLSEKKKFTMAAKKDRVEIDTDLLDALANASVGFYCGDCRPTFVSWERREDSAKMMEYLLEVRSRYESKKWMGFLSWNLSEALTQMEIPGFEFKRKALLKMVPSGMSMEIRRERGEFTKNMRDAAKCPAKPSDWKWTGVFLKQAAPIRSRGSDLF